MTPNKPFAPSAMRNRDNILQVLEPHLQQGDTVLEIGSGTGQHLSWFAEQRQDVIWQPTDLIEKQSGIRSWVEASATQAGNLYTPKILDVESESWPVESVQVCYTANTLHIMAWSGVVALFEGASKVLCEGGRLCVYGPFKINGSHTGSGNARFDAELKRVDRHQGLRDLTLLDLLASKQGLVELERNPMPSNNFLIVWKKPV